LKANFPGLKSNLESLLPPHTSTNIIYPAGRRLDEYFTGTLTATTNLGQPTVG
jgi:hypothetical protein